MRSIKYRGLKWLALAAAGTTFILGDCDPTIQTTVENGIISLSQSFITVFFRALTAVITEKNAQTAANFVSDLFSNIA